MFVTKSVLAMDSILGQRVIFLKPCSNLNDHSLEDKFCHSDYFPL